MGAATYWVAALLLLAVVVSTIPSPTFVNLARWSARGNGAAASAERWPGLRSRGTAATRSRPWPARPRRGDPSCEVWAGAPSSCTRRAGGARPGSRGRAGDGRRRGTGGVEADFLWFMSSDLFLTLPQLLARHRRQVILLVVR